MRDRGGAPCSSVIRRSCTHYGRCPSWRSSVLSEPGFGTAGLRLWAESGLWPRIAPARSGVLRGFRLVLMLLALAFALLAAARPQVGARLVQVERQGTEIVIVLDVSLSMEATDVVPNRLERSKQEIRELLEGLRGDKVGLVVFAGSSFLLCPLTLDAAAANLFLDAVSVDILPDPGTNLEEALGGALRAFGEEDSPRGRAVILFTDGESHLGDPLSAVEELSAQGTPLITVGVGTPQGEPIPGFGWERKAGRIQEGTVEETSC